MVIDKGKITREKLVQVLERGKESAAQMRRLLDHHHAHHGQLDAYSLEVLASFSTALAVLHSFAHFYNHDDKDDLKGLNPILPPRPPPPHHHHLKSDQEFDDWEAPETPKGGRGCYKRRKTEQSEEIETSNTDDGYAWRKYGQKAIQNTKHPRNYFRCTHKTDQGCQATKQIQQISENPPKFKIIYHGHHTCKNPLKTPPVYLHLIDDHDQDYNNSSSTFLSFETSKAPKQGLNNPFIFPSSSSSSSNSYSTSTSPSSSGSPVISNATIKDEIPSELSDHHHHGAAPLSSNFLSTSSDLTTTDLVSDDVISLAEVYSSAVGPHGVELEEDYSRMMAESIDFSEVFLDYDLLCG